MKYSPGESTSATLQFLAEGIYTRHYIYVVGTLNPGVHNLVYQYNKFILLWCFNAYEGYITSL